jgi:Na+/H+-dicarboxylate symporter
VGNDLQVLKTILRSYASSLTLIAALVIGSVLGIIFGKNAAAFKPFGDIFLNLLFVSVVPLIFFSITSAISGMKDLKLLGRIFLWMMIVFIATSIISSCLMMIAVQAYPPAAGVTIDLAGKTTIEQVKISEQILGSFTVPDFYQLLSRKNMLALVVFALLIGLASSLAGEKGKHFTEFLGSANSVMIKLVSLLMYYAPIGLGAYFAYIVGVFGPQLLGSYARAMMLYYPVAILYFFIGFTIYVYLAGNIPGVKKFWSNIAPPALTALATGSSVATVPITLEAARKIGIPRDIREIIIPIGTTIHMDGSCIAAVLKIAFLFGLFGMNFSGWEVISTALVVSVLTGLVVVGMPGGGLIGEILILTLYGFPPEALLIITMIGTLVDPPATMINAISQTVTGMIVSRIMRGKHWLSEQSVEQEE